jgi:hypothetical protein
MYNFQVPNDNKSLKDVRQSKNEVAEANLQQFISLQQQ